MSAVTLEQKERCDRLADRNDRNKLTEFPAGATDLTSEKTMSKAYKTAAVMLIAASAAALIAARGSAAAATSESQPVSYCLLYNHGGADCSFTSKTQCEATASGREGECYRDAFGGSREFYQ